MYWCPSSNCCIRALIWWCLRPLCCYPVFPGIVTDMTSIAQSLFHWEGGWLIGWGWGVEILFMLVASQTEIACTWSCIYFCMHEARSLICQTLWLSSGPLPSLSFIYSSISDLGSIVWYSWARVSLLKLWKSGVYCSRTFMQKFPETFD